MDPNQALQELKIAVQNTRSGTHRISELVENGWDLNECSDPQHPISLAIALQHFQIVVTLLKNGVRFDHRDPGHYHASVIQRLRSLRDFFQEVVKSPDHKESRGIAKRRLKGVEASIAIYDEKVASGEITEIPDAPEPSHEKILAALKQRLQHLE